MSVHKEISAHSKKQNEIVMSFLRLEEQRELFIEEAITLCKQNKPFTTDTINDVTRKMNELARLGIAPQRKIVTKEMVEEYVARGQ
ncbi:hypothetical protein FIU87_11775 [Bacillus sp. THAF10]|uniref:YpbS family protein n=1 Tax=Bacillus sp. THAF10 TaxID=2587848 RepID=UPI001268BEAB|nr:YpbS family protein [Bacillus sp. THAF10]QFT89330.1 hypothetical protein FIU87_11775 [Bacillus sp. THAF10]